MIDVDSAILALVSSFAYGLVIGFVVGLIRSIIFQLVERKHT